MAVSGTYIVTVEMLGNQADGTVYLDERGTALKGSVEAMGINAQLEDGKVAGNSFTGMIEGPTPLGTMRFKVKGAVKGDDISGSLRAGLVGASFSGTRAVSIKL